MLGNPARANPARVIKSPCTVHRVHRTVAALCILLLLRVTDAQMQCEPVELLPQKVLNRWGCQRYKQMCIDQTTFISYDPQYDPRRSTEKPPQFNVKDVVYNWPNPTGNGDKFLRGRDLHVAPVTVRVNTSAEACEDLRNPTFSNCTSPIVLWQRWMFNVGELFETSFVKMSDAFRDEHVDARGLTLVVATPHGLRVPPFARVFFESLFNHEVTSLADFSARKSPQDPSNATVEGTHVRCFKHVTLCKITNRANWGECTAGEELVRHYQDRLPPANELFDPHGDEDALKVVFAARPDATGRSILNERELIEQCNSFNLASELGDAGGARRLKCVAHVYGRDLMVDMALSQVADVLVATHGAAGFNAFLMTRGSSYLEVLPYKFRASWANTFYAKMLELDRKIFYWSLWLTREENHAPSTFEGTDVFLHDFEAREHHVRIPWDSLAKLLVAIVRVNRHPLTYKNLFVACEHSIDDDGRRVDERPLSAGEGGWSDWSWETYGAAWEKEGFRQHVE